MKYMGSKSRIAKDILPIMLKNRRKDQYYVELFVGGCNYIDKVDGLRIGNDINPFLIAMWKGLQDNLDRPYIIDKCLYSHWRNIYNQNKKSYSDYEMFMIGWIGFMGSFNGRFFDGGYSGHNVGGRDYISEQIKNTERQIDKIKEIHFISGDYRDAIIPDNSIIYLDIPYMNTKKYSLSRNFNYELLFQFARDKSIDGHTVFVSEYNAPDDFKVVWSKSITNSMSTTNTYNTVEKLFIYDF